jgi:hypothetical protein
VSEILLLVNSKITNFEMDNPIYVKLRAPYNNLWPQTIIWKEYCIPFWESLEPKSINKFPACKIRNAITNSSEHLVRIKVESYKF